jgi:hypothetical protein
MKLDVGTKIPSERKLGMNTVSIYLALCILMPFPLFETLSQSSTDRRLTTVKAQTKPDKPWKEYATRTLTALPSFTHDETDHDLDIYGGHTGRKADSTGFFHVAKLGDRWWLIDPLGHPCYNRSIVSVTVGTSKTAQTEMKNMFSDQRGWVDSTSRLLAHYGFNGVGAWSDSGMMKEAKPRVPYTLLCSFMSSYGKRRGGTRQEPGHTGYPNDCIFVFDPGFESFCEEYASKLADNRNDPYLIGYFSDNEMPFHEDALNRYLGLDKGEPGYLEAERWLKQRKNGRTDTTLITPSDRQEFLEHVADSYFRIVSNALKKYDPHHLFIGARFYGRTLKMKPVFRSAGRYVDVVSINYYDTWTPAESRMKDWVEWSGKPIIITEWYVKGADAGLPNYSGAGWIVPTQNDRGLFYQNFALALAQFKGCVGWHWFKYMDNDPLATGVDPSNNDANKGIVSIRFQPYIPMLERMKQLNDRIYRLIDYFDANERQDAIR